jgi:hypothetical protein
VVKSACSARAAAQSLRGSGPRVRQGVGASNEETARTGGVRRFILASSPRPRYHQPVPAREISTSHPDPDSLRLELQEALVTVRHWQTQSIQAAGFIVAGNVRLVAYGFSQKQAGIFLVGSVLPIILLMVYSLAISAAAPLIMLAIKLERDLQIRGHSLAATYARNHLWLGNVDIENLNDAEVQKLGLEKRRWFFNLTAIILYICTMGQIVLGILCLTIYHYRLV